MIADSQTAQWQLEARYGREPTDQQRAWLRLVNKVRQTLLLLLPLHEGDKAQRAGPAYEPPGHV
jgi:hypothetical protein